MFCRKQNTTTMWVIVMSGDICMNCQIPVVQPLFRQGNTISWREGAVLQEIMNANIITLYKNNRDRSDCTNYSPSWNKGTFGG